VPLEDLPPPGSRGRRAAGVADAERNPWRR
jgi:hypothetical protein